MCHKTKEHDFTPNPTFRGGRRRRRKNFLAGSRPPSHRTQESNRSEGRSPNGIFDSWVRWDGAWTRPENSSAAVAAAAVHPQNKFITHCCKVHDKFTCISSGHNKFIISKGFLKATRSSGSLPPVRPPPVRPLPLLRVASRKPLLIMKLLWYSEVQVNLLWTLQQ